MSDHPTLAEILPPATIPTLLYTVGAGNTATGTIFCMNQSNNDDLVGVGLVPNGNLLDLTSWIAYNTKIYHGQSLYLQQIYLNSGDSIWAVSQNGTSNFIFNGLENPTII
jgi:hypothetical protein